MSGYGGPKERRKSQEAGFARHLFPHELFSVLPTYFPFLGRSGGSFSIPPWRAFPGYCHAPSLFAPTVRKVAEIVPQKIIPQSQARIGDARQS